MECSVNKVTLIGNLGANPERKTLPSGTKVAILTICSGETESGEPPEWHRVVMYGRLAEIALSYLKKGRQVYVEGRLQTRKWVDAKGEEREITEVIVENTMRMLGSAR